MLRRVAAAASEGLRVSDMACRIGGEEFAILLPETGKRAARAAADRLCARVRALPAGVRRTTVSCGVASYPVRRAERHGVPRRRRRRALRGEGEGQGSRGELHAGRPGRPCIRLGRAGAGRVAEAAAPAGRAGREAQPAERHHADRRDDRRRPRGRWSTTTTPGSTSSTTTAQTLEPIAFRGTIDEYEGETLEDLRVAVGEGITGTAADRGKTLNMPDASECPFAAQIPGTDDIDESILAVPFIYDRHATGVLVLAKLGLNQFSALAVRQVELLAAHAAVALENARLLAEERRAAATAEVLLDIATAASREASPQVVGRRVVAAACRLAGAAGAALVVERGGRYRVLAACGDRSARSVGLAVAAGRGRRPGVAVVATERPARACPSRRRRPAGRGARRRARGERSSSSATDSEPRRARRLRRSPDRDRWPSRTRRCCAACARATPRRFAGRAEARTS